MKWKREGRETGVGFERAGRRGERSAKGEGASPKCPREGARLSYLVGHRVSRGQEGPEKAPSWWDGWDSGSE